jgi:hypothetical protein
LSGKKTIGGGMNAHHPIVPPAMAAKIPGPMPPTRTANKTAGKKVAKGTIPSNHNPADQRTTAATATQTVANAYASAEPAGTSFRKLTPRKATIPKARTTPFYKSISDRNAACMALCPLWVISGHLQCTSRCLLCARSRHASKEKPRLSKQRTRPLGPGSCSRVSTKSKSIVVMVPVLLNDHRHYLVSRTQSSRR